MPFITDTSSLPTMRTGMGDSPTSQAQAVQISVQQDRNPLAVIGGVAALGAVDLADTIAASIPVVSKGLNIQRGDVDTAAISGANHVLNAFDAPGLTDFYHDYKGGIEATSGIMGLVAADTIARRLTAPATAFMGFLKSVPYVRRVAALDEQYNAAMTTVRAADMNLASRGALGVEQYVGRSTVADFGSALRSDSFVASPMAVARNTAVSTAKRLGFAKGASQAAATEALSALTLNQNSFLYDDDMSHNMMWQAAGVALGGVGEAFATAYQIRKFVNGDEIKRAFAGALDPRGNEEDRLLWKQMGLAGREDTNYLSGSITDRITNLAVNASHLLNDKAPQGLEGASELLTNRSALATQQTKLMQEEAQKVARKGISSNGLTRFDMTAPGYGNHVSMLLHRDPGAMYGVEQMGGLADNMNAHLVHEAHSERLQELIDQAEEKLGSHLDDEGNLADGVSLKEHDSLQRYIRRLEFETTLTPMVSLDGELMPLSESEAFSGFKEPKLSVLQMSDAEAKGDKHGLFQVLSEEPGASASLGTDFIHFVPGMKKGATLSSIDHFQMMNLYRLGEKAIDHMSQFKGPIPLPKNPDFFQLDMAEQLLRKTSGRANVVFPEGMTRESARVESLIQKAEGLKAWQKVESRKALQAETKGSTYEGQLSKLRLRYNIPSLTAYERGILGTEAEHPVEQLLRGMADMTPDEIRKMSLADIQESMAQFKRIGDVAPVQGSDVEDLGKSFGFMKDEKGNPIKPLMMYKRPFQTAEWTQAHTAERMAAAKMYTTARLTDEHAGPVTKAITGQILQSPEFDAASRTHELMDNQIQGNLSGAAPQTQAGATGKALITSDWRDRDNATLLAATRLRENVSRLMGDMQRAVIDGAFQGNLSLLANPRNAASKLLLDQFHSFRGGWDLADEPLQRADGFHAFLLKPTQDNAERFLETFGREMAKEGEVLRAPNGKEVVLDSLGMDLQQRFNQVTDVIKDEKNTLLRANGRSEIDSLAHYVPPPNTNGKYIGFTFGPDNKPVRGMTVIADTPQEFSRLAAEMHLRINSEKGLGYTFRSQDQIKDFATIWDKVQMDFVNPGVTAVQPGKAATGRLGGQAVKSDAFKDSLKYLQDSFNQHGNDIIETLMKEQINSSKARSAISTDVTKNASSSFRDAESRNIYDYYLENLTGRSKLNPKGSFIGRFYNSIEGPMDKWLAEKTPGAANTWNAVNEWVNKKVPWSRDPQARKDFDALTQHLGKYMPFEDAAAMAESKGFGATPLTVKKITGKLNSFSAAVVLRMAEVVHPIMNLSGIINASPAVVRNFSPMRGETTEDFAKRIGHIASIFSTEDGATFGVPDMVKMTSRAFTKAWSKEAHPDFDYMVRRGYLTQEVAEFHKQFGAIDTPGAWSEFFNGSPTGTGLRRKGVVGWLATLSDKSEDFSRSWAHMVGLELGDSLGLVGQEARHGFAHDVANKMIANYSPQNRPEIFQGALGAPIGLFQSFVMNYYERLFRYVETKDYKSLATQMATQAGLFGVSSIPGWGAFSSLMQDAKGDGDADSSIFRRFGGNAGSLISHGVLSSLPRMFGADGVDLYSRGDVGIRQLQVQNVDSITSLINSTVPAANVAGKAAGLVYHSIGGAIKLFMGQNPNLSMTQVGEVLSNAIANRPISGMIEQALSHGNKVDGAGQLVTETHGLLEMTYRLMGVRSMRQSEDVRAFYANRNAMTHQAALQQQLGQYTRTMIRDGDTSHLPQVYDQYIKNGGDPRFFRRWMKSAYITATQTRSQRQLTSALKSHDMNNTLRLLDAGVSPEADEQLGDTDKLYVTQDEQNNGGESLTNDNDF